MICDFAIHQMHYLACAMAVHIVERMILCVFGDTTEH